MVAAQPLHKSALDLRATTLEHVGDNEFVLVHYKAPRPSAPLPTDAHGAVAQALWSVDEAVRWDFVC